MTYAGPIGTAAGEASPRAPSIEGWTVVLAVGALQRLHRQPVEGGPLNPDRSDLDFHAEPPSRKPTLGTPPATLDARAALDEIEP